MICRDAMHCVCLLWLSVSLYVRLRVHWNGSKNNKTIYANIVPSIIVFSHQRCWHSELLPRKPSQWINSVPGRMCCFIEQLLTFAYEHSNVQWRIFLFSLFFFCFRAVVSVTTFCWRFCTSTAKRPIEFRRAEMIFHVFAAIDSVLHESQRHMDVLAADNGQCITSEHWKWWMRL